MRVLASSALLAVKLYLCSSLFLQWHDTNGHDIYTRWQYSKAAGRQRQFPDEVALVQRPRMPAQIQKSVSFVQTTASGSPLSPNIDVTSAHSLHCS